MLSKPLALGLLALSALSAAAPTNYDGQLAFGNPVPVAEAAEALLVPSGALSGLGSLAIPREHLAELQAHIAGLPERRKVQLGQGLEPIEITEGEKALLTFSGVKFIDVTDDIPYLVAQEAEVYPTTTSYKVSQLEPLYKKIDLAKMRTFLTKFSSFRNRYYRSATGVESQQFLLATIRKIVGSNSKLGITVDEFPHPWGQNSIVVKIPPAKSVKEDEKIVILGAHQDSTNLLPFLPAPGADDDGSGTTTLITALAILVNASFVPSTNPVEFHFYSAEEGGLLGSAAVAQAYGAAGKKIRGFLQQDMTGSVKQGTAPTFGVINDFVDASLTNFIVKVAEEYGEIPVVQTQCGYACSDHASWSKIGAPSSFVIESSFEDSSKDIHSTRDTIDAPGFSFEHIAQYTRLSIALAVELGGGKSLF